LPFHVPPSAGNVQYRELDRDHFFVSFIFGDKIARTETDSSGVTPADLRIFLVPATAAPSAAA
jgi:hypothetical protein